MPEITNIPVKISKSYLKSAESCPKSSNLGQHHKNLAQNNNIPAKITKHFLQNQQNLAPHHKNLGQHHKNLARNHKKHQPKTQRSCAKSAESCPSHQNLGLQHKTLAENRKHTSKNHVSLVENQQNFAQIIKILAKIIRITKLRAQITEIPSEIIKSKNSFRNDQNPVRRNPNHVQNHKNHSPNHHKQKILQNPAHLFQATKSYLCILPSLESTPMGFFQARIEEFTKKIKGIELNMRETKEILNDTNFNSLPWIFSNKKPHSKTVKPPSIGNHRAKERIGKVIIYRS